MIILGLVFSLLFLSPQVEAASEILGHNLLLELDLEGHGLKARDTLRMRLGPEADLCLSLNNALKVKDVKIEGKGLDWKRPAVGEANAAEVSEPGASLTIEIPPSFRGKEALLELSYEGVLYEPLDPLSEPPATITKDFVYLSPRAQWYADLPESLSTFRVGAYVPLGYEVVTHGRLIEKTEQDKRAFFLWEADYPSDSCFLVAAGYRVNHEEYRGIDLYTFFFPEEQELSTSYIETARGYLAMYEEMFGPYPFSRFAVVENLFPTGYGMPSYTLLGKATLRFPFIVHISLGHEVAHNWWGNSVFTRPGHGNWCEGLTSYVADYHYQELNGPEPAREYRREVLRTYSNYIHEGNDFALEGLTEGSVPRTEKATRAILYGKASMVFHMLRGLVGEEGFFQSLRQVYKEKRWQPVGWGDFQEVFQGLSGQGLDWFFHQWVYSRGAPLIELGGVEVIKEAEGSYRVDFELLQGAASPLRGAESPLQCAEPFRLTLPVVLETTAGRARHEVEIDSPRKRFSISAQARPLSLAIDPGYDVFRRLSPEELPATLDKVLGDRDMMVVYPTMGNSSLLKAYEDLARGLRVHGKIKADREVAEEELSRGLLLLGGPSNNLLVKELIQTLPSFMSLEQEGFTLEGKRYEGSSLFLCLDNPWGPDRGVCIFFSPDPEALGETGRKLIHYGKYSYVVFKDGTGVDKGTFPERVNPLVCCF